MVFERDLSMSSILDHMAAGTLHNLIVLNKFTFDHWDEASEEVVHLNASHNKLASFLEPISLERIKRTRAIKLDVANLMLKMNKYFVVPIIEKADITSIDVMQEDVDKISNAIDDSVARGATFNRDTFGCERSDLLSWRCLINEQSSILRRNHEMDRKVQATQIKLATEDQQIDWPDVISQETWPRFLQTWLKEKSFMGGEYFLCKHLISHMHPRDKPFFQTCTDSTSIVNGLTMLFGTLEQNIPKMVDELLTLDKPKENELYHIRRNLLKIKNTMS